MLMMSVTWALSPGFAADGIENAAASVCDGSAPITAAPTEGAWVANEVHLEGATEIDRITYTLEHGTADDGTACDASLDHAVAVYIVRDEESEELPVAAFGMSRQKVDDEGAYAVVATLDETVFVDQGERLVIAIQATGDPSEGQICVQAGDDCEDTVLAMHGLWLHDEVAELEERLRPRTGVINPRLRTCGDFVVSGDEWCDLSAPREQWDGRCGECDANCVCTAIFNPDWDEQPPTLPEPGIPMPPDPGPY